MLGTARGGHDQGSQGQGSRQTDLSHPVQEEGEYIILILLLAIENTVHTRKASYPASLSWSTLAVAAMNEVLTSSERCITR